MNFKHNLKSDLKKIKFTKKKLLIFTGTLLVLALGAFIYSKFAPSAVAAWFDDAWNYRVKITFNNNGAADADKKVKFDVDTTAAVAAGKMQPDCGDVRFTSSTGQLLQYYLDTAGGACNTNSTDFYVLMPSIVAGDNLLFMYYGNSAAVNGTAASQFSQSTFSPNGTPSQAAEENGQNPTLHWSFNEGYGTSVGDTTSHSRFGSQPQAFDKGDGSDGAITISGNTNCQTTDISTADGDATADCYATYVAVAGAATTTVNVADATGIVIGDEILLVRTLSATAGNIGQYEFVEVTNKVTNALTVSPSLANTYSYTSDVEETQVVRVPQYTNVTVNNAVALTVSAYSTSTNVGGILAFRATGTVIVSDTGSTGSISVSGAGYPGGNGGTAGTAGGGGAVGGAGTNGGVGNAGAAGLGPGSGGGGGYAGNFGLRGAYRNAAQGGRGGAGAGGTSGAGGGGAFATAGTAGGAGVTGNGGAGGSAGNAGGVGAAGTAGTTGSAYGNANLSKVNLGSGGGGGGSGAGGGGGGGGNTVTSGTGGGVGGAGGAGGAGGGILMIFAANIQNSGTIAAGGVNGGVPNSGANAIDTPFANKAAAGGGGAPGSGGGGGAGGSIYLKAGTVSMGNSLISAAAGTGGAATVTGGHGGNAVSTSSCATCKRSSGAGGGGEGGNGSDGGNGVAGGAGNGGAGSTGRVHVEYSVKTGFSSPAADYTTISQTINWKGEGSCLDGSCAYFNGTSNYVSRDYSTSDAEMNPGTSDFAVSLWFRHNGTISADQYLLSRYTGSGFKIYMKQTTGVVCFGIDSDATWNPNASNEICSTSSLADSQWHYLVAVKNGTTNISLFIDGVAVTPVTGITGSSISGTTPTLYLGVDSTGSSGWFTGYIDEFKYYNYAKTATQLNVEYQSKMNQAGATTVSSPFIANHGLVGWWKLDETTSDAADSSDNGLTLTNPASAAYVTGRLKRAIDLVPASSRYLYTTTSISAVKTVAFWVFPDADSTYYFDLDGTNYVTTSGTTLTTTGAGWVNPKIYVNGQATTTITASVWSHVVITTDTAITASAFKVGRIAATSNYFDGKFDDVRLYNVYFDSFKAQSLYSWTPAPVAWWKLDEGTGTVTYDSSGNANTSSAFTNNVAWTTGKFGSGLSFDGTDDVTRFVETASTDLGVTTDSYSVSAWLKTSTDFAASATIAAKDADNTAPYPYWLYLNSSEFACFQIAQSTNVPVVCSATALNDGAWHHVAGVRNTTTDTISVYVDGVLAATPVADSTAATTANNDDVSIGSSGTSYTTFDFNGVIDDVRIYDYAFIPGNVVETANAGHPLGGSPVGSQTIYWKLDEQNGSGAGSIHNSVEIQQALTGNMSGALWLLENTCKIGGCLNLNGQADSISGGDVAFTDSITALTASLWLYPNTLSTDDAIIAKGDLSAGESAFVIRTDSGSSDEIRVYVGDGTNAAQDYITTTNLDLAVGSSAGWQHLAVVYDGSVGASDRIKVYKNARPITTSVTQTIPTAFDAATNTALTVGDSAISGSDGLIAYYDEIKIYSAALTPAQVLIDMNAGSAMALGGTLGTHDNSGTTFPTPVGWWKLDENTGTSSTYDTSGNTGTGTLNGTMTQVDWVSGKLGSALDFDGLNDYISIADSSPLSVTGDLTLSAWIRPTANTAATSYTIVGKWDGTNKDYLLAQYGDEIRLYIGSASTYVTTNAVNLTTNTWYHIEAVYTAASSAIVIYVNGAAYATTTTGSIPTSITDHTNSVYIGTNYTAGGGGSIDVTIAASADDAWYRVGDAAYDNTYQYAEVGYGSGVVGSVMRFPGITGLSGQTITASYFTVWCSLQVVGSPTTLIYAEDAASPTQISDFTDLAGRPSTANTVSYNPTTCGTEYAYNNGPSLNTIIQELADSYSPTAIQLVWYGTNVSGTNSYYHTFYDLGPGTSPPKLHIEYTSPNATECFVGQIDDVRIYNSALSRTQTEYLYNTGAPAAWYKFDECQGTTAYNSALTGNGAAAGNNGTLSFGSNVNTSAGTCNSGTSTEMWNDGTTGKINSALGLDGNDDFVTTAAFSPLAEAAQNTKSFSWGGWFYPVTGAASKTLIEKATEFRLATDGSSIPICSVYYSAAFHDSSAPTTALSLATWNHVLCTYDGTNITTYLNGKLIKTSSETTNVAAVSSILYIGESSGATQRFEGLIDDVRIYNYAANATQVRTIFSNASAVQFAPLTGSP